VGLPALVAVALAVASTLVGAAPAQASGVVASVGDVSVREGDAGGARTVRFPVTLSGPATTVSTVSFTVTHETTDAADVVVRTGTITFKPGGDGKTRTLGVIAVKVLPDTSSEEDETFTVTLTDATGDITLGDTVGTGTILDDDPIGGLTVSVGDTAAVEGDTPRNPGAAGNASVPVTLSAPAAGPVTVVATVAAGTATAGVDFKKAYTKTLTFKPGQTTRHVTVGILPDTAVEGDETVTITLSSPTGGATLGRANGTLPILDDEILVPCTPCFPDWT
jgi:chitinase